MVLNDESRSFVVRKEELKTILKKDVRLANATVIYDIQLVNCFSWCR